MLVSCRFGWPHFDGIPTKKRLGILLLLRDPMTDESSKLISIYVGSRAAANWQMKNHVLRWIRGMKTAGPNQLNSNEKQPKQPTLSLQKVVQPLPVHYW
jgi:hypothetical protein